jgi:very-short-patch-repair endonuclease
VIAHVVVTDIGKLEVDLCLPDHRLILEVDGGQHLLTLNTARDVARDAALTRLGWSTVRVTAAAVRATDGRAAVAAVRPLLEARGRRP